MNLIAYNPPLSVSADADVVNRAIELQKQEATTVTSEKSQPPKSAAQLRIQAQGALLGLAPHNIRYDELVAEGINPVILKQLYEEVGIRVATPKVEKQTTTTSVPPKPSNSPKMADPISKPALPTKVSKTADVAVSSTTEDEAKKAALAESPKPLTVVSPPSSNKPMERKEVIARMLAAKAAKATESKATPKDTPSTTPPNGSPAKSNGAVVKQKNKAQTELARQRIEELKKQAMMKIEEKKKQNSQAPPATVPSEEPSVNLVISAPAVQHPLPVRPPPSSNPAQIPGLSLTGADEDGDNLPSKSPVPQAIGVDSTPVPRAAQRKRPRASDFDEPTALPKKPFSYSATPSDAENKLIIDISEDESLYGDDESVNMDVDSSPEQELAPAPSHDAPKPPISRTSSTGRLSSSTPQGNDQENLREKDLQIQAMHRRIAELEQKRKDKLAASRTQSPRPLSDSIASSSVQSSAAGQEALETSVSAPALSSDSKLAPGTCTTSISTLVERPDLIDSFSEASIRALASMDLAQLDNIRSKILRIKEIESGFPELDAAIESSEQRLAAFKQEADSLVAEITMGKEGRLQLFQELRKLIDEIDGLTLEDLDELRRQAEIKEQHLVTQEGTIVFP